MNEYLIHEPKRSKSPFVSILVGIPESRDELRRVCLCGSSSAVHIASFLCSGGRGFDDSAVSLGLLDLASVCDLFCWRADWLFVCREVVDFLPSFFPAHFIEPPGSLGALPSFPSLHFHFFCPSVSACRCHGACGRNGQCGVVLTQLGLPQLPGLLSSCTGMTSMATACGATVVSTLRHAKAAGPRL